MFEIKMPARINVLGNPSDANEGAHQTISAAVNVWGGVEVRESDGLKLSFRAGADDCNNGLSRLEASSFQDLEYGKGFDLQVAAIRTLEKYSDEFRRKYHENLPSLTFWTDIPRQSGLGGSTVLVLLTMVSLISHYKLDKRKHNEYALGELAQRAEEKELGITCGYADRYVPVFGDVAYIDYRGKLFHKEIKTEPYCTYEKLGDKIDCLPLVMCSTGLKHDSGDVHRPMRARYLEEYKEFKGDYNDAPFMVRVMKEIGDTAWQGKIALLEGDLFRFGELMNENHRLVNEMMLYCGFSEGAGEANNAMIEAGLKAGALGAKLTGAGGGGSVFMLSRPGEEERIAESLKKALRVHGYGEGRVFIPRVVSEGAIVIGREIGKS